MARQVPARLSSDAEVRSLAASSLVKLFDSLYEGAVVVDHAGRITWINDKYKALIGWNGSEAIEGRAIEEVLPNSQLRRVVETGQADLLDVLTIGGRQMVVSRIPLHGEAGNVIGALGVILYDRLQALKPIVSKFQRMQTDLATVRKQLADGRQAKYRFSQFIGASRLAVDTKEQARRAAEREGAVLLLGETGTGKELLAHAIHAASRRGDGPLVSINAAAIPEALLEAELFGVEPGAYTGAGTRSRSGKFTLADGGTLFLDEVGDMPLALQPKLLRVLQEGEVEPVGGNQLRAVNVRVIAATSRDLKAMIEVGTFRADLYYRLNVLPIRLPPLRERREDISILCETLLEQIAEQGGEAPCTLAADGLARLAAYDWPGNVRELRNVLEQAVAQSDNRRLTGADFHMLPVVPIAAAVAPGPVGESALRPVRPLREVVAAAERNEILRALEATGGVKMHAAKLLGISRAQLYEKLGALGVASEDPDTKLIV
ncbi:MAG: sigma 54-interacting transcriptional regulator [Sulfuritalea sp.]|nr:sigma 54-interacting transcriptional regulator [Sulfuritalea sp.]